MIVGILRLEFHVIAHSLKEKRSVVRKMIDRARSRFRISVAEVDHQDLWQRTAIGVALVGLDARAVARQLDKISDFLEDLHVADLVDRQQDVLHYDPEFSPLGDDLSEEAG